MTYADVTMTKEERDKADLAEAEKLVKEGKALRQRVLARIRQRNKRRKAS